MAFLFKRYLTCVVMLVTIVTHFSGIHFYNDLLKPLEEVASTVGTLSASDEDWGGSNDFKPPKSSYTDYAAICSLDTLFSLYVPSLAHYESSDPFRFLPEVYPDIFVPPQNLPGHYV